MTEKGEERTRRAARGLLKLEREMPLIFTSPLVRCTRSAELLREAVGAKSKVEALAALAPGGSWRHVLQRVAEESPEATVVLVGHEPQLGKLAGVLVFGAPAGLPLKKAGACAVAFEDSVAPGAGRLCWFLTPRLLSRLAPSRSKV